MKIDNDVPIPPRGGKIQIPLAELHVDQSVFVPHSVKPITTVRSIASQTGLRLGRGFTCHKVTENGEVGTRVWRVV